ncbi:sensor histidine kinase [Paenibacillus sp. SGZ-1009]|uniref:sensor histidine kinase n=1 Tax=Paenibacillus campi TaxID=3106031 RepID=UPI002AFDD9D5|nr:histidine kinase [Paenibacillus sp. SGZ-1009]
MRRWRRSGKQSNIQHLGTQLIVYFMAVSMIVFSLATYFLYTFMLGLIKEQNEQLLYQQFQQNDHNIHSLISDVDRLSKLFLLDGNVQSYLQSDDYRTELENIDLKKDIYARIANFISNYNYIHSIYIITDHNGALGGDATRTLVHEEAAWTANFFRSQGYERAKQAFPNLTVIGGMTESYYNPYISAPKDDRLISLIRGVRALYEPNTNATLIFNLDEHYLASTYSASLDMAAGNTYIINAEGTIISGSSIDEVGQKSPYLPPPGSDANFGSYDTVKNGDPIQIVYYKLQAGDWYMMREVPLGLFSQQIFSVQRIMVIVFCLSILVIFGVSYFFLKRMIRPLKLLAHKLRDMSKGELGVTFTDIPNNEFGTVMRRFNEMSLSIVQLLRRNNEIQEQRRELEIEALQYQINPHFLYNTLNMIRWMATMIKADQIVTSVVALGNMLRPIFASKDSMCTLRDELSYLENYIKIINLRFNSTIEFTFDIEPELLDCRIPRFILQPLVENSIQSGRQDGEGIEISIEAYEDGRDLWLSVVDSGSGFTAEVREQLNQQLATGVRGAAPADQEAATSKYVQTANGDNGVSLTDTNLTNAERASYTGHTNSSGSGVGLYNINKRIQLYFGEPYGVTIPQVPHGAEVTIRLPRLVDEASMPLRKAGDQS